MEAIPARHAFGLLARHYRACHKAALGLVHELSEEQFRWRPSPGPQSIGWNLWHIARWDDIMAEGLIGRTPSLSDLGPAIQIWKSRELASRWGLGATELGVEEGGTSLAEVDASAVRFPPKSQIVEYAAEAFKYLDSALEELDDSLLLTTLPGLPLYPGSQQADSYGENVVNWMEHAYRHLGTMEALKGMLGLRGSVDD
jgi:hypothetical protein